MSAYLVPKSHITYLVEAGCRLPGLSDTLVWFFNVNRETGESEWGELSGRDRAAANRVGQMLTDENQRSVNYRSEETDAPEAYAHECPVGEIDPVSVLAACNCYRYQACEHPGYDTSEAEAFVRALEAAAGRVLIKRAGCSWGAPKIERTRFGARWAEAVPA